MEISPFLYRENIQQTDDHQCAPIFLHHTLGSTTFSVINITLSSTIHRTIDMDIRYEKTVIDSNYKIQLFIIIPNELWTNNKISKKFYLIICHIISESHIHRNQKKRKKLMDI